MVECGSFSRSPARWHALHLLDDRAFSSCVAPCLFCMANGSLGRFTKAGMLCAHAWTLQQRFCHGMTARARPAVIGQCACCEHNLYSMTVYVHASAFMAAVCTYIAFLVPVMQSFELKCCLDVIWVHNLAPDPWVSPCKLCDPGDKLQ